MRSTGANVTEALSTASELQRVGLGEALELCLLLCDRESEKFSRAAVRWHGRYCCDVRGVELEEAQAVLACLGALRGPRREPAAHRLADLVYRRGFERACEALNSWAEGG